MKLFKMHRLFALLTFIFISICLSAQVTIGSSYAPAKGTLLQIKDTEPDDPLSDNTTATKGGLGLPRVALVDAASLEPFINLADQNDALKELHSGLVVYNIATVGNDLIPGTYMWNGSLWARGATRSSEFWLNVSDVELIFPSGLVTPIIPRILDVTWAPTDRPSDLLLTSEAGGGILGFNPPASTPIGGAAQFTVNPSVMTTAEVVAEPFLEKRSVFTVAVNNGSGGIKEEEIKIRQINYNLILKDLIKYPIIGHNTRIQVLANTEWEVTKNDPDNIIESFTPIQGGNNTDGITFTYKLRDDSNIDRKKATFTFSSPTGLFNAVVYEIEAMPNLANSYMVKPDGNVLIPVMKAVAVWEDELRMPLDLTKTKKGEIIWQEDDQSLISSVTLVPGAEDKYASLFVATTPGKMGNASIAYMVDGKIAWTWHLWVTDYNPNSTPSSIPGGSSGSTVVEGAGVSGASDAYIWTYHNGFTSATFMDRDYGASPTNTTATPANQEIVNRRGFVYEWGRKDPLFKRFFTYHILNEPDYYAEGAGALNPPYPYLGISAKEGGDIDHYLGFDHNLAYSIHNPYADIIAIGRVGYDWYSYEDDVENLYMWNTVDGLKGKYDPCPEGWRVPVSGAGKESPWYGLTPKGAADADYTAEGAGVYYSGFHIDGTGGALGTSYKMLTASPTGTRNYTFHFASGAFNTSDNYARAHAHPVRCVKE